MEYPAINVNECYNAIPANDCEKNKITLGNSLERIFNQIEVDHKAELKSILFIKDSIISDRERHILRLNEEMNLHTEALKLIPVWEENFSFYSNKNDITSKIARAKEWITRIVSQEKMPKKAIQFVGSHQIFEKGSKKPYSGKYAQNEDLMLKIPEGYELDKVIIRKK